MVLIHGFLTPWQIWMPHIEILKDKYNIFAIALNAHTEASASEFVSISHEAEEIAQYFNDNNMHAVEVICGISLGGAVAFEIWKNGLLKIGHLVLDGAPLVKCPRFAVDIMIKNYKNIIHASQKRNAEVLKKFKKNFLPEKYLNSFLSIADNMTDGSIENAVNSVFSGNISTDIKFTCRVLFVHGTKANEFLSKRSAKILKKHYDTVKTVCFKGDAHCYTAIYRPEKWVKTVTEFLENK